MSPHPAPLRARLPEPDPCNMPTGGGLCMLPFDHPSTQSCLPEPVTYPPTVTVAVTS